MPQNEGKKFEDDIKKSCEKQSIKLTRLKDAPNQFSFGGNSQSNIRFTQNSPYDFEIFKTPYLIPCELKSTKLSSFSLPDNESDNKKTIKARQIEGLLENNIYENCYPGFIFNFRSKNNNTYFMYIEDFVVFQKSTNKKSINEKDVLSFKKTIKIENTIKKVRYNYNIEGLFKNINRNKYIINNKTAEEILDDLEKEGKI